MSATAFIVRFLSGHVTAHFVVSNEAFLPVCSGFQTGQCMPGPAMGKALAGH